MDPILSDATSGENFSEGCILSSIVIVGDPPLVKFSTAFVLALICGKNFWNASGDWSGFPVWGSRAWRWIIAAPASAAPTAASTISSGVIGKWGDIEGVWIAPVTAQVMITLPLGASKLFKSWLFFNFYPEKCIYKSDLPGQLKPKFRREISGWFNCFEQIE